MLRFHRFVNPHNAPSQSRVRTVFEYLVIIFGIFPMALMVNWVLLPHAFVGGGLTGICSAIYYVTGGLFPSLFPEYGGAALLGSSSIHCKVREIPNISESLKIC